MDYLGKLCYVFSNENSFFFLKQKEIVIVD